MGRKKRPPDPAPAPRPAAPAARAPRAEWKMWLGLFALALVVRLLYLGRADLWCDEILFLGRSALPKTPGEVFRQAWDQILMITHLPLPEIVQNLFLRLGALLGADPAAMAVDPFWQRVPAALWGALTVPVFYSLARRLLPRPAPLAAALLLCCFFFPVYYARDAYYYAPLIFFATATLYFYVRILGAQRLGFGTGAGLAACATGMAYAHISATVFLLVIIVAHWGYVVAWKLRNKTRIPGYLPGVGLLLLLPLLLVAPFFYKLATQGVQSGMRSSGKSAWELVYITLGKMFLGNRLVPGILASLCALAGAAWLWLRSPSPAVGRMVVVMTLAGLGALGYSAARTQFVVRYLSSLTPGVYLLFTCGLLALAQGLSRVSAAARRRETAIFWTLAGLLIAVHAGVFLPNLYRVQAKARDYGGVARWLNANLAPGTPYFFECGGWDLRFVPGYFPTPELTPTVTFAWNGVQNGVEYETAKRAAQRRVAGLFPESACVQAIEVTREDLPVMYQRKVELRNEPVLRLMKLGIWIVDLDPNRPGYPDRNPDDQDIWYNTSQDAMGLARAAGDDIYFIYNGARCAGIGKEMYAHLVPAADATVRLVNLRGTPVAGQAAIQAVVFSPAPYAQVTVSWQGRDLLQTNVATRAMWSMATPPLAVPIEGAELQISARAGKAPVEAIAIIGSRFRPAATAAAAAAAGP